ncbi:Oxoglutarate/iron-dependent dioxygenase [Corchorus capsularis]|uniref:Oxoglutarate/iron-dependent dioxygenase n=1 Tax=Corchorus capsularis TaxID=210143 RepID=A0A1R3G978_COCAP|nr:Oxoglutarate/iron-dependent dioxygenase [Corchorus capsularis]
MGKFLDVLQYVLLIDCIPLTGGVVHEKGLLSQDLPSWLTKITQRIYEESGLFPSAINHVLINEYLPNQGIMPHQDGPAYYPVVAILSLGSPVVMNFTPHSRLQSCGNYLHGIEDSEVHQLDQVINETEALSPSSSGQGEVMIGDNSRIVNRTTNRISLTCRLVLKVHKNLFKF